MNENFVTMTMKNKPKGERPKIKEKYILTKVKSLDELIAFNDFSHFSQLTPHINEFFNKFREPTELTTYSFVKDFSLIQKLLLDPHKASLTPSLGQKASALILRIQRFRLKFFICYKLNEGAPDSYTTIEEALEEIIVNLTKKKVSTTFIPPEMAGPHFSLESTLTLIASELREAEKRLRRLLGPLRSALGATVKSNIDWLKYHHFIAGLGVCIMNPMPDWHYLFSFMNLAPQMDPVQLKQWQSYMYEINLILQTLFVLCPENIKLDAIKDDDRRGINFKLSKLQFGGKLDPSTFTAIITALNRFVPQLWVVLFTDLLKAGIIFKQPEVPVEIK